MGPHYGPNKYSFKKYINIYLIWAPNVGPLMWAHYINIYNKKNVKNINRNERISR